MTAPPLLLIHGAAVTAAVWDPLLPYLNGFELRVPERPRTGDIDLETEWLAPLAEGAFVVGMSGGATLGLALASTGAALAGALLHEPAVGSLAPGLLAPMAAAFAQGGVAAFGRTLYGPAWKPSMATDSDLSLPHELAMFRSFEPTSPTGDRSRVTISVGQRSPGSRHQSVAALAERFGYSVVRIEGAAHFVTAEAPNAFAALVRSGIEQIDLRA